MLKYQQSDFDARSKSFSLPIALVGLSVVLTHLNIVYLVNAVFYSGNVTPPLPLPHLTITDGFSLALAGGAHAFDWQYVFGLMLGLTLYTAGPSVLLVTFNKYFAHQKGGLFATCFGVFLLHSMNMDWLFVQSLKFEGIKWLLVMAILIAFALKISISMQCSVAPLNRFNPRHFLFVYSGAAVLALTSLYFVKCLFA